MTAVGIDGCRDGWFAVVLRHDAPPAAHHLGAIADIAGLVPDAEAIGIDMPIGLPDDGIRASDLAAKELLGPRRSSLFITPVAAALVADTHAAATAISVERTGKGMSRQAYGLRTKIFEVADWLPSAPCPIFEVHPELSFAMLLGHPATASKKTWAGVVGRRRALQSVGIDPDPFAEVAGRVATDDVLDAAVAAWSARRWLRGEAVALPDPPEVNAAGQSMAIWY